MAFEAAIEAHLVEHGGYEKGNPDDFDRARCLFPKVLLGFIKNTQPKIWDTIAAYHGKNAEAQLLDDLTKALSSLGMLHVLRHGFNCFGKLVRVAYFAPASGMNPETAALYAKNRLTVTRQVHFSDKDEKSLDLVLAINGLPVATAELKNPLTKQNVFHAMRQYREDRDPREPMFRFKERALVHFAVDPDLVYMTTKLEGKSTHFCRSTGATPTVRATRRIPRVTARRICGKKSGRAIRCSTSSAGSCTSKPRRRTCS